MKYISYLLLLISCSNRVIAQTGLDPSFANNGLNVIDTGAGGPSIYMQNDQKMLVFGSLQRSGKSTNIIRFNSNGSIDNSFGDMGYVWENKDYRLGSAVLLSDGKILMAGSADSIHTLSSAGVFFICRTLSNGLLDSSFGNNGKVITPFIYNQLGNWDEYITSLALQSDGKIIAAGNTQEHIKIVRYFPNGKVDSSFGINGNVKTIATLYGELVNDMAVLPDDKIVVGAGTYSGDAFLSVRYLPSGVPDSSYGQAGKVAVYFNGLTYCRATKVQPDGRIIQAGFADSAILLRLDTHGNLDSSFGRNGIARFTPGDIRSMLLQPDGKIVMGGNIDTLSAIYRALPDGKPDNSFGSNGIVKTAVRPLASQYNAIALQADGKIVAAGSAEVAPYDYYFTLARYLPNANKIEIISSEEGEINIYPNPAADVLNMVSTAAAPTVCDVMVTDVLGRKLISKEKVSISNTPQPVDISRLAPGIYMVTIIAGDGTHNQFKFVKK